MEALYPWPESPLASLFVLWLASSVFLWAAREPMSRLLGSLGNGLADGLQAVAARMRAIAGELDERARAVNVKLQVLRAQARPAGCPKCRTHIPNTPSKQSRQPPVGGGALPWYSSWYCRGREYHRGIHCGRTGCRDDCHAIS